MCVIRAIIFDCFGVLTADSWHEFRMSLPKEQQGPASDLNHQYGAGLIGKQEFLSAISEVTGKTEEFISGLIDNEDSKNTVLLNYIATKLKHHYKIGILSNVASNWIRDYFLTPDEQKLFDVMVFSFEEGTTKPDPRIYEMAADRLGVAPKECVYIDDIDRYAAAAENVGMKAITYKNFPQLNEELNEILYRK